MTSAEYERERAALRETLGDKRADAGGKYDQALAKLFARSGWRQEELAEKEGQKQPWAARHLKFGQFLSFCEDMPTGINPETGPFVLPPGLSERKFRSYWERTEKGNGNERQRFIAVQRLMSEELNLLRKRRPLIGRAIIDKFADGKWHAIGKIAAAMETDEGHVADTLHNMQAMRRTYGVNCEKKVDGKDRLTKYRIFNSERTVNTSELATKLRPIIKGLKAEGRKHAATMSVQTVAGLAVMLERLLTEWTEGTVSPGGRPDEMAAQLSSVTDKDDE